MIGRPQRSPLFPYTTFFRSYPLLYRLEKRGWIQGRWVEKADQRRRRYYRLTTEGHRVLAVQRKKWQAFVGAVGRVAGVRSEEHTSELQSRPYLVCRPLP